MEWLSAICSEILGSIFRVRIAFAITEVSTQFQHDVTAIAAQTTAQLQACATREVVTIAQRTIVRQVHADILEWVCCHIAQAEVVIWIQTAVDFGIWILIECTRFAVRCAIAITQCKAWTEKEGSQCVYSPFQTHIEVEVLVLAKVISVRVAERRSTIRQEVFSITGRD